MRIKLRVTIALVGALTGTAIGYNTMVARSTDSKSANNSSTPRTEVTLALDSKNPLRYLDQIAESDKLTETDISKDKSYFAISANQDPVEVNLNLQILRMQGYDAFIEETGEFYRTIVATELSRETLQDRLRKLNRFEVDKIWKRAYDNRASVKTLEEKSKTIETKSKRYLSNLTRDQYIAHLKPHLINVQKYNNGKEHSRPKPEEILGLIYDAANEFRVPLLDFTALIENESSFKNVKGDLQLGVNNLAEGIGQIRKPTQKYIFRLMKQEGIEDLPEKLPYSILPYPELQTRMSAFYLARCIEMGGSVKRGIALYNAGENSRRPNTRYISRVQARQSGIAKFLPGI